MVKCELYLNNCVLPASFISRACMSMPLAVIHYSDIVFMRQSVLFLPRMFIRYSLFLLIRSMIVEVCIVTGVAMEWELLHAYCSLLAAPYYGIAWAHCRIAVICSYSLELLCAKKFRLIYILYSLFLQCWVTIRNIIAVCWFTSTTSRACYHCSLVITDPAQFDIFHWNIYNYFLSFYISLIIISVLSIVVIYWITSNLYWNFLNSLLGNKENIISLTTNCKGLGCINVWLSFAFTF